MGRCGTRGRACLWRESHEHRFLSIHMIQHELLCHSSPADGSSSASLPSSMLTLLFVGSKSGSSESVGLVTGSGDSLVLFGYAGA